MPPSRLRCPTAIAGFVVFFGSHAAGQTLPWDTFVDPLSSSACDVVNASNAELVVLSDTGQLVIVTGADVTLVDSLVTT